MLICPLEKVECEFAFAGCQERFLRDDQDSHLEKAHKEHFSMLVRECSRMKRKVEEKDEELRVLKESFRSEQMQVKELKHKIKELETTS